MSAAKLSVRQALVRRLSIRSIALQTGFGMAVLLALAVWLQIPDASAMDVLGSVLFGLLIVAATGAGQTWLLKRLAGQSCPRLVMWRGIGLWLAAALVWWAWFTWMVHLDGNTYLYASFGNSKLPHGLRAVATYARLQTLLHWLWTTLAWGMGAMLALGVAAVLICARPAVGIVQALRSPWWWLAMLIAVDLGVYGSGALASWVPGHALGVEAFSLVCRLAVLVVLDGVLVSGLFASIVVLTGCEEPASGAGRDAGRDPALDRGQAVSME